MTVTFISEQVATLAPGAAVSVSYLVGCLLIAYRLLQRREIGR